MNQDIFNIFKVFNSFPFPVLCCLLQLKTDHSPLVLWIPSPPIYSRLFLQLAPLSPALAASLFQLDWFHQHIKLLVLVNISLKKKPLTPRPPLSPTQSSAPFYTELESAVSPFTSSHPQPL